MVLTTLLCEQMQKSYRIKTKSPLGGGGGNKGLPHPPRIRSFLDS